MPLARGADGGKRGFGFPSLPASSVSRDPPKLALRGLRALCTNSRAATVHAALIQGVLATLKAAARKFVQG